MTETETIEKPEDPRFMLGQWIGRRDAVGLFAGRCSAVEIESLRHIKDSKLYTEAAPNWEEFCTRHLHASRRTVDLEISYLREFGPSFFTIRQLTHVTAKEYPAIAPHIVDDGLHTGGAITALVAENKEALITALRELRSSRAPKPPAFDRLLKRCQTAARAAAAYPDKFDGQQKALLLAEAFKIWETVEAKSIDQ